MAIIYSYPIAAPKGSDTIVGTRRSLDELNDHSTVSFTIASIANYVANNLPDDLLNGTGTANTIPIWNNIHTLEDSIITQGFDSGLNKHKIVVDGLIEADNLPNLSPGKIWVGSTGNTIESTVVSIDEANEKVTIEGTIDLNDGNDNTIIGTSAGGGGTSITAVGYNALAGNTGDYSNGFGSGALAENTGNYANGFGAGALSDNIGNSSNGFGNSALSYNTGDYSNGFGSGALIYNAGDNSNGFGFNALQYNTGVNASGFGHFTLYNNTGDSASGFGYNTLANNIGDYSSGFGNYALQNNTGDYSSGFGVGALLNNTGTGASGFGGSALYNNGGQNNTGIGYRAGFDPTVNKLIGPNNTFLGANSCYETVDISNSTAVGANVRLTDSNTVILGNGASVGIGTTSPNYKLDVDDTIGVGNSLIVNHVPGAFPRVFPPVTPGGFFETEPTGRVGVVNNQDSGEWAFSAVSIVDDGTNFTNRSGLLHSNVNAYRLVLSNTTEENIRLNSDGNSFLKGKVAIGHDTPIEALDVDGIVKVSNRVKTNQISVNGGSEIRLNQATFYNTGNICNKDYTDIGATLHLRTNEPLAAQSVIAITRGGQGTGFPSGITQSSVGNYQFLLRDKDNISRIRFSTGAGDALIDTNRIVLFGNTFGQDGAISISSFKGSNGAVNSVMKFHKSGLQSDNALEFRVGVNLRGSISYSDTGTAYNVASDYRLKENVVEITDGIERLKQLKPSKFNFISNPDKVVDGFIAHEVQSVIPEAVTGDKDAIEEYEVTSAEYDDYGNLVSEAVMGTREAYQQIDQAKIVPLLTAALQEAIAKIESLEARIQALENN